MINQKILSRLCYPVDNVWVKIAVISVICSLGVTIIPISNQAWAAEMELLTPRSGATVLARNPETHLILRWSGTGNSSRVRVEKSGTVLEPIVAMEGDKHTYLHFRLPLERGKNDFTVIPGNLRLELNFQMIQGLLPSDMKGFYFFHQNDKLPESCVDCHDLLESQNIDPVGLQQQISCITCHKNLTEKFKWKHSTTINQQCFSCHLQSLNFKPWRIGFREGRIDDTCLACHTGKKEWQSREHRHGALIGGCTLCHNPHGSQHQYQLWAEGSLMLCVACHDDQLRLLDKEKPVPFVHGIITGNGCVACHDPHATENPFVLHKPINRLCNGCHQVLPADSKSGHPVANHPVAGPSERRRPGRELTCVGCHDPHGSAYKNLLIQTKLGGLLCRGCHKR